MTQSWGTPKYELLIGWEAIKNAQSLQCLHVSLGILG